MRKAGIILALCIFTLSSCVMRVDSVEGKTVAFTDLPKEVQDTVLYWAEHEFDIPQPIDSTLIYEFVEPNIICFDDEYSLTSATIGPWTKYKLLTRLDGKRYKLARDTPEPIIVRNDTVIIPKEYNILTVWDPNAKWKMYRLR